MYSTFAFALVASTFVAASIPNRVYTDTECKVCPYELCVNKIYYEASYYNNITLNCWTEGTPIVNDTTWLKTQDGCYVTQYDLYEYAGDSPHWTTVQGRTRYMTECNLGPWIDRTELKYYKYGIDLRLTCVAPTRGEEIMRKKYEPNVTLRTTAAYNSFRKWYKTNSNCYVHETTLWPVEDEQDLEDCGPIPRRLDPDNRTPEPTPSATKMPSAFPKPSATPTPTAVVKPPSTAKAITVVGEEYVNCTANGWPKDNPGRVVRQYEFGQEVILQCGSYGDTEDLSLSETIFLFTTDFCWIKDQETDPQLQEGK
ncbi:uncharacterized protein BDR25DRAFT_308794 [Lindgomyces ingoldianus]|uniref:Uncharacterized protein n=1 Tax=Lindgomyces ingoldianus TaxID=673940 RepID=A0ACB6RFB4_9PLEO|nr:uncharacterized protein BDR25DRAFT_308794 [Lindgomyces ingoldianus]KAF2477954.1 hypothetical protein BDR25DRAFT_308794 [Lindgomyces ingoldianus]